MDNEMLEQFQGIGEKIDGLADRLIRQEMKIQDIQLDVGIVRLRMDKQETKIYDLGVRYEKQEEKLDALTGTVNEYGGKLDALDGRINGLTDRMDGLDGRMDGLDGRMDGLDGRMDSLAGRMEKVEAKLDDVHAINVRLENNITKKLDSMQEWFIANYDKQWENQRRGDAQERRLEDHETRIEVLEIKTSNI